MGYLELWVFGAIFWLGRTAGVPSPKDLGLLKRGFSLQGVDQVGGDLACFECFFGWAGHPGARSGGTDSGVDSYIGYSGLDFLKLD